MKSISRKYGFCLAFLLGLFCFRVLAQGIQSIYPLPFLPPFEAWHSGALPYWVLLLAQLIIIFFAFRAVNQFLSNKVEARRTTGRICLILGGIYFYIMLFRLLAGLTVASDHFWFGQRIPTFFHLVLASLLLLAGRFHFKYGNDS